ncbi:MAG TPA: hypothetical protein VHY18_04720 [Solirubrobacteraceae bacterium]|jgi:hypothetical protein|nr:hypothetical protein [Solirubrobacteraceae bacterium]
MAGQADPIDRGRETLLRALRAGGVRFVVIGGAALQSHGQRYETEDIDIAPDRAQQNLARLADVLNRLECSLKVDPAHPEKAVSLPLDYFTASVSHRPPWNLRTAHGKLDLTLAPSGFPEGYTQLIADAEQCIVAATTITVAVASLADVEHSKRTADRAKDRAYLQQVGRLGAPQPTPETPPSAPAIAHDLLRAYARREELRAARTEIADTQTRRRDRARALAYDLGLKAIEEEITALEQSNGGPLGTQQRAEAEHPKSSP